MQTDQESGAAGRGATPGEAPDTDARSAVLLAIKNGFTLGAALLLTQGLGLSMRVVIPRHLGPTQFGSLNFADAFTQTLFVLLGLGMDQHIRKEAAVRPTIVNEFWGGAVLVRIVVTLGLVGAMEVILRATHRPADLTQAALIYAISQFVVTANSSLGAMLHAKGRVAGMSALSVTTKVVWALGVVVAIAAGTGLWGYAVAYFASEAIEVVVLWWLARKHLGLVFRVDLDATKTMLKQSLPYSVNTIAISAYSTLGVALLEFTAGSKEVGLYGVAQTLGYVTLMVSPIIGWVLTPMLSRAASRSRAELFEHVCRSMEMILTVAVPASLMLNLGSDWVIRLIFGASYAPAAMALRVLSTTFVLTYVAMIYSTTLVMLERAWLLSWISVCGLVINAVLNLVIVRFSVHLLGEGGGGTGCALAMLITEIVVTAWLAISIGRGAFDRRSVSVVLRSLAAYGVVSGAHVLMRPLGPIRLAVDVALYFVIAIAIGALRPKELVATVKDAMSRRNAAST